MAGGRFSALFILVFLLLAAASCNKKEVAITLPPRSAATQQQVQMGENYATQIFYNLETRSEAKRSDFASWTLAFESQPSGTHVFLNGGAAVFSFNTHATSFGAATPLPPPSSWQMDDPAGDPAQTAIGNWAGHKGEVFLIKISTTACYKLQLLSVTDSAYTFRYGALTDTAGALMTLYKDPAFSFVYFHLPTGKGVQPDALREDWDIVFTHYRYIYRQLNDLPYYVTGVLLNPYTVTAAADSTTAFADITVQSAEALPYTAARDIIGYDWKSYDIAAGRYTTRPQKNYIVRTRHGQLWKLHFLDFYSPDGVKGSPAFEVERLE